MKANRNMTANAARSILQRTADGQGVPYAEVYESFQDAIRLGLASTKPETMRFWSEVKRQAGRAVPTPEDFLIYIHASAGGTPESRDAMTEFLVWAPH